MGGSPASPGQETWLGWLPLPALVLAADGSAVAVNPAWATMLASDGDRWLDVVEPPFRRALRARLRLAVAAGEPGSADCRLASPRPGRWSRWWWHPVPPRNLVVCVGVIEDGRGAAPPPVRSDTADPPAQARAPAPVSVSISTDRALAVIGRIFAAGLALESAASLLQEPLASVVLHAIDDLDQLVNQIRSMVFEPPARPAAPPTPEAQ